MVVTREHGRAVVAALARWPSATPTLDDLAEALGWTRTELEAVLRILEARGRVETWRDAGRARVMLSMREARRMGLALGRRPERWIPVVTERAR